MRYIFVHVLLALLAIITTCEAENPRVDLHDDPLTQGFIARLGTVRFQVQIVKRIAFNAKMRSTSREYGFRYQPRRICTPFGALDR